LGTSDKKGVQKQEVNRLKISETPDGSEEGVSKGGGVLLTRNVAGGAEKKVKRRIAIRDGYKL